MTDEKPDVTALVPTGEIPPHEKKVSELAESEIQVIRDTYARDATDAQFNVYMSVCRHRNLNPFKGEVHFIPFDGRMVVVVGIHGLLKIAERGGNYASRTPYLYCGPDGEWKDAWLNDKPPAAIKVGVYRKGHDVPIVAVALWSESAQYKTKGGLRQIWNDRPVRMLEKCALAKALREACPDVDGIYIAEEFGQTIEDMKSNPNTQTPRGAANQADYNPNDTIPFGKHKGQPWSSVDPDYLEWVASNMDDPAKGKAILELERRKSTPAADENGEIKDADFDDLPPDFEFLRNKIAAQREQAPEKAVAEIIARLGDPTMVTDPMVLQQISNEIQGTFKGGGS